jgi:hypothetical protein
VTAEVLTKVTTEVSNGPLKTLQGKIEYIEKNLDKMGIITGKQSQDLLQFTRDFTQTKDLLKTFMLKYDFFTNGAFQ